MTGGYYQMHRGWLDHHTLQGEPFDRRSAWCWLVEEAQWQGRRCQIGGQFVELKRGQLSHSTRFMARAWGWSEARVRRFAAVLDGAIFGDHCSPISDTTVLSSFSSACDHLDHVATQLPYALTTMIIASILGYVFVALGVSSWTFFILFPITAFLFLRVVGKKVETDN